MNAPPPLLELRDVTAHRGSTRVFDGLDLTIHQGESTVVLGPNGAGKTTLLQLLSREIYPVHRPGSRVRILGRERWDVFALRRQLGMVSPDLQMRYQRHVRALDVVLSGYFASVGLYRRDAVSAEQEREARRRLEEMGVGHLADAEILRLSTGEQRRCLLARALVHDPRALLLDEPTTSLDLRAAFELVALLRALIVEGRTLVLVTHDLHDIAPEFSRVVLLRAGQVVADGPPERILTSESLSELYGAALRVVAVGGWFRVVPAEPA